MLVAPAVMLTQFALWISKILFISTFLKIFDAAHKFAYGQKFSMCFESLKFLKLECFLLQSTGRVFSFIKKKEFFYEMV
jgi:hypothetical protein